MYNVDPAASSISKPIILFQCGRIRFEWLKAQIILVWLLCLSLFCSYCLFSITWSFNLVIQKSRLTSFFLLAATQRYRSCTWIAPQIHLVPDPAASINQQAVFKAKVRGKILVCVSDTEIPSWWPQEISI